MNKRYNELLKDGRWQMKRIKILERDHFRCVRCGRSAEEGTQLHVHHKFYDGRAPWEYEDKDLITLCEDCHNRIHGKSDDIKPGDLMQYEHSDATNMGFASEEVCGKWFKLDGGRSKWGLASMILDEDSKILYAEVDFEHFDIQPISYKKMSFPEACEKWRWYDFISLKEMITLASDEVEKHKICYTVGQMFFRAFLLNLGNTLPFGEQDVNDLAAYSDLTGIVNYLIEIDETARDLLYAFIYPIGYLNYGIFKCLCMESNLIVGTHDQVICNMAQFLSDKTCKKIGIDGYKKGYAFSSPTF